MSAYEILQLIVLFVGLSSIAGAIKSISSDLTQIHDELYKMRNGERDEDPEDTTPPRVATNVRVIGRHG